MVLLFEYGDGIYILLTKRSEKLKSHSGDVCFPGGKCDRNESVLETALREAHEEIGLNASNVQIVGQLTPLVTTSEVIVFPVVGVLVNVHEIELKIHSHEVDDVFACPLQFFLSDPNHRFTYLNQNVQYHSFYWKVDEGLGKEGKAKTFHRQVFCGCKQDLFCIWGLTAIYALVVACVCLNQKPTFDSFSLTLDELVLAIKETSAKSIAALLLSKL